MNKDAICRAHRILPLPLLILAVILAGCSSASKQKPRTPVEDRTRTVSQPITITQPAPARGSTIHRVVPGDTLYSIARQYQVSVHSIVSANNLADANQINVGQDLTIPRGGSQTTGVVTTSASPKTPKETPIDDSSGGPTATASGNWAWPIVGGEIVARFGENGNMGIDIAAPQGTPVLAAEGGKVIFSNNNIRGYGNLIVLRHWNNYVTAYGYNSKLLVKEGTTVNRGDKIAEVGSSGTDSPKLHFEIRNTKSKPEDPLRHLPKR